MINNKVHIFFNKSTHLPIISSQNIFACLSNKQLLEVETKDSFLMTFNRHYGDFIQWLINNVAHFDNTNGFFTKGYYFYAETYKNLNTSVTQPRQCYLTVEGWHLFLFLHKEKFRINKNKYIRYLNYLTSIILSQLNIYPEMVSDIKISFGLYDKCGSQQEFVSLIIKSIFDLKVNKIWYLNNKIQNPLGCTFAMKAWFFDIATRYFFTLFAVTEKKNNESILKHNYHQLWEYLLNRIIQGVPMTAEQVLEKMISIKLIKKKEEIDKIVIDQLVVVTGLFIYEGEVKSRPLIQHGMALPQDLVIRNDGNIHLNSSELELLNKFF